MLNIPANLGQRILDAARIAAAMHEAQTGRDLQANVGGADATGGVASATQSEQPSKDGLARFQPRFR
jgi:hypothetical protein